MAEGRDGPTYEYDVALSCAPEDAVYVAQVAGQLQERGVRVFFEFDDHRIAEDWGRDLQILFDEVFRKRARFAIPFVSTHYARRLWPTLQHRSAQARALFEDDAYVLPVRLDDTELAGLRPTIRCLDARQMTVARLVEIFLEKLHASAVPTAPPVPALQAAAAMAGPSSVQAERIELALSRAIRWYATTGARLRLAGPLLAVDGFLARPDVAAELAQVVAGERNPDAVRIGAAWSAELGGPPGPPDLAVETGLLLDRFGVELLRLDPARPPAGGELTEARSDLQELRELRATGFEELVGRFATADVRDAVTYWTGHVAEWAAGFVGRQFLFDRVSEFARKHPRGYLFIQGDPGIGKTAFAAQLIKTEKLVHHFNRRNAGICRPDAFLRNVCAQLIALHDLPYRSLPEGATRDAGVLNRLLEEVSAKLGPNGRAIVVVDALDEADMTGTPPGANRLLLPEVVPPGIYFVVTARLDPDVLPRVGCEHDAVRIYPRSEANLADVREWIGLSLDRPGIQRYLWAQGVDEDRFARELADKSGGNFMYLHYVLPEIERGAYRDLEIDTLPAGLERYYEDHWARMRGADEDAWFRYKLPVLMALTVAREPVSLDLVASFSRVEQRARIRAVLHQWSAFLHTSEVVGPDGPQMRYQIYHESFHDFVRRKQEVADERVDLAAAQGLITSYLMRRATRRE